MCIGLQHFSKSGGLRNQPLKIILRSQPTMSLIGICSLRKHKLYKAIHSLPRQPPHNTGSEGAGKQDNGNKPMNDLLDYLSSGEWEQHQLKSMVENLSPNCWNMVNDCLIGLVALRVSTVNTRAAAYIIYRLALKFHEHIQAFFKTTALIVQKILADPLNGIRSKTPDQNHMGLAIELHLYGFPIFTSDTFMVFILSLLPSSSIGIILRFGVEVFLENSYLMPRHSKRIVSELHKHLEERAGELQIERSSIVSLGKQLQEMIIGKEARSDEIELEYSNRMEKSLKQEYSLLGAVTSFSQEIDQGGLSSLRSIENGLGISFHSLYDRLQRINKIRPLFLLLKECQEFLKPIEYTPAEKELYLQDPPIFSVELHQPGNKYVTLLQENPSFLTSLRLSTTLARCKECSQFFLSVMNCFKNREELIEMMVDDFHSQTNLPYLLKTIQLLAQQEQSFLSICEAKAKKICGYAVPPVPAVQQWDGGAISPEVPYFKHKLNPKYIHLICEMAKLKLIPDGIILSYLDYLSANPEAVQNIKEAITILEQLSHIMFYRSLPIFAQMKGVLDRISAAMHSKTLLFHFEQLQYFQYVVCLLTNGRYLMQKSKVVLGVNKWAVLFGKDDPVYEQPNIEESFTGVLGQIRDMLLGAGGLGSEQDHQEHKKAKHNHKGSHLKNKSEAYPECPPEVIEEIGEYLLYKIDHCCHIKTYYYASLLKELRHEQLNHFVVNKTTALALQNIRMDSQKSVHWGRFLGELYNYQIIGRKSIINVLYQLIEPVSNPLTEKEKVLQVLPNILQCVCSTLAPVKQELVLHESKTTFKVTLRFLLALRSIVLRRKEELIEMDKIEHLYSVEEIMQYFNPSLTLLKDPHHIDDLLKLYTPEFSKCWDMEWVLGEISLGKSIHQMQDERYLVHRVETINEENMRNGNSKTTYRVKEDYEMLGSDKKMQYKEKQPKYRQKLDEDSTFTREKQAITSFQISNGEGRVRKMRILVRDRTVVAAKPPSQIKQPPTEGQGI